MYEDGQGVPQDYTEALRWISKAADQGYANGQTNLGAMYYRGQGVPQDSTKAVEWFKKAAEQGNADAQQNLGELFADGVGVSHDTITAAKWLILAKAGGSEGSMTDALSEVEQQMTPAQIDEAQRLAQEWWTQHHQR